MLRTIKRIIYLVTRQIAVVIYDVKLWLRDLWAIHVRRQTLAVMYAAPGMPFSNPQKQRVAIVALYPTPESVPFSINLLDALTGNGFYTIAMTSANKDPHRDAILSHCHVYEQRPPLGRDFGAYKSAISRYRDLIETADVLVLANDSLYYTTAFREQLTRLLDEDADWMALFENHEKHYHAQSFFQIFRKPIVGSAAFKQFWTQYMPFSNRVHAIDRGEVLLSASLIQGGFFPFAQYSTMRIVKAYETLASGGDRNGLVGILSATLREDYAEVMSGVPDARVVGPVASDVDARILREIAGRAELLNPTHALALMTNYLFGAPIKRDVAYRGMYHIGEITRFARGYSDVELALIERDMRRKGVPVGIAGVRKLLYDKGRL
jgi:hypothetical protein